MTDTAVRFFRFGIVGLTGIVIDFSITWLFKERLKVNKFVANGAGFVTAVSNNYILNRIWTFNNNNPHILQQFMLFFLISIVGLGLNTAVLYFLHEKKKQHFYLSKIIAIAIVFCWNFAANTLLTFRYETLLK